MGLLAPLYALAALAVIGPIVFHLIRRQPQGQIPFSSLMFLSPSPPRLTRRSRLDNLLLLILRALAILLIAFAFARPYLRQESLFNSSLAGRNIVVLLDTSASMQREDVWEGATETLAELLDSLSPEDRIALYTIDEEITPIVPFERDAGNSSETAVNSVRKSITQLKPTWRRTQLAEGLRTIADMLSSAKIEGQIDGTAESEIVLISDLHAESELESLQGYPWPEAIGLDVRQVLPTVPGNARASLMVADEGESQGSSSETSSKVRIENNQGALSQTFQLSWGGPSGPDANSLTTVQVPAGQVRVVAVASRPNGATYIQLAGDAWDGDNRVFAPETIPAVQRIAFVGPQSTEQEKSLGYFLKQAPLDTELVRREVVSISKAADLEDPTIKVVVVELEDGNQELGVALRKFASEGGTVLACLTNGVSPSDAPNAFLEQLCDTAPVLVREAKVKDYSLVSGIDYTHPVFAPFADPRFNDFSKIRFWNHRVITPPEEAGLRVVASFDDKSPMLLEQPVGEGRVWILAAGWQPSSSTLALSSKFVPILMGILDPSGRLRQSVNTFEVGDSIDVSMLLPMGESGIGDFQLAVLREDGSEADSSVVEVEAATVTLLEPGLFTLQSGELTRQIAVQVPVSESQHLPLDTDVFLQYGISLGKVAGDAERRDTSRQLQVEELESKQRLWQWLIAAGLAVLAIETWLAGSLARRGEQRLETA